MDSSTSWGIGNLPQMVLRGYGLTETVGGMNIVYQDISTCRSYIITLFVRVVDDLVRPSNTPINRDPSLNITLPLHRARYFSGTHTLLNITVIGMLPVPCVNLPNR